MKKRVERAAKRILVSLLALLLLASCGEAAGFTGGAPKVAAPEFVRTPPPLLLAEYVGANQEGPRDTGDRSGLIDMTNVAKGYVTAQCTAPVDAKLRVIKGDESEGQVDDYTLANDGRYNYFPITRGDGNYTFVLFIFVEETSQGPAYERFLTAGTSVALESEFAPFIVPNAIVDYNADSQSVKQSYEIAKNCSTNLEVVQQVYDWLSNNISYDTAKADALRGVNSGYAPNPDETLSTRKGICYDYASLAAAMLRANGIPTKLIKGDVADGAGGFIYHAWNVVWLEESGWIAVELAVNPNNWTRIDTTFAAAGTNMGSFIGDGTNYTELSQH